MPDVADTTIIGAGVVGLAIAAQVAGEDRAVYVLEQHETFGKEQTGRTGGGTHAAWFFPHVDSWDSIDYEYGRLCAIDTENQQRIYDSVKDFMPFLELDDLLLDQAAVHAELLGPTGDIAGWLIRDESDKGLPGFINLIGMDAPAFTSAPSIAEYVGNIVTELSA